LLRALDKLRHGRTTRPGPPPLCQALLVCQAHRRGPRPPRTAMGCHIGVDYIRATGTPGPSAGPGGTRARAFLPLPSASNKCASCSEYVQVVGPPADALPPPEFLRGGSRFKSCQPAPSPLVPPPPPSAGRRRPTLCRAARSPRPQNVILLICSKCYPPSPIFENVMMNFLAK
jgi:hypothetical protein